MLGLILCLIVMCSFQLFRIKNSDTVHLCSVCTCHVFLLIVAVFYIFLKNRTGRSNKHKQHIQRTPSHKEPNVRLSEPLIADNRADDEII